MANPWSNSVEDIALLPLRRFLDNDHRVTSVALAEDKLDDDDNDLITKLRFADRLTAEYLENKGSDMHSTLNTEALLANDLARELSKQLDTIYSYLESFNDNNTLKLALLETIKSCNAHKEELSVVNRAKLIECLKSTMDVIPKIYKKANLTPNADYLEAITAGLEILQSNEQVTQEDLYEYVEMCTLLLDSLHQKR